MEMAQPVPDDLDSILKTHMKVERTNDTKLSSNLHTCSVGSTLPSQQTHMTIILNKTEKVKCVMGKINL